MRSGSPTAGRHERVELTLLAVGLVMVYAGGRRAPLAAPLLRHTRSAFRMSSLGSSAPRGTGAANTSRLGRPGAETDDLVDGGDLMAEVATLTVTLDDDGNVFVDVACTDGDDLPLVEAIGLLEMAKSILLAPAEVRS